MTVADVVGTVLGADLPVAFEAYDGSRCGPADAPCTIVIRSEDALRRLATAPGELGFGRAYVAGDIDFEGDIYAALELRHGSDLKVSPSALIEIARLIGTDGLRRLPPPPEEARIRGRRHTRARDAAAIAHHYNVGNDFYRLVLGPTMTYSCAVWDSLEVGLDAAQEAKYALICDKLHLEPGMRLLDVGCGWGGMAIHAAQHHRVEAVGVTLSEAQADLAEKRAAEAGVGDRVEIRVQDYRDVHDGRYDAISSIGMFEHVGLSRLAEYFASLRALVAPGGRVLNHAISRPAQPRSLRNRSRIPRRSFLGSYVFPDAELHEIGEVVTAIQRQGLEVRHVESLREHYALTLRAWVANLEANWEDAVALAGEGRARVWRLYMAASAVSFEDGTIGVHQSLAVNPDGSASGFPLRPAY